MSICNGIIEDIDRASPSVIVMKACSGPGCLGEEFIGIASCRRMGQMVDEMYRVKNCE